jgi:hypothetical protein
MARTHSRPVSRLKIGISTGDRRAFVFELIAFDLELPIGMYFQTSAYRPLRNMHVPANSNTAVYLEHSIDAGTCFCFISDPE